MTCKQGVKVTILTSEHYDKKHMPHRKISDADIRRIKNTVFHPA